MLRFFGRLRMLTCWSSLLLLGRYPLLPRSGDSECESTPSIVSYCSMLKTGCGVRKLERCKVESSTMEGGRIPSCSGALDLSITDSPAWSEYEAGGLQVDWAIAVVAVPVRCRTDLQLLCSGAWTQLGCKVKNEANMFSLRGAKRVQGKASQRRLEAQGRGDTQAQGMNVCLDMAPLSRRGVCRF